MTPMNFNLILMTAPPNLSFFYNSNYDNLSFFKNYFLQKANIC